MFRNVICLSLILAMLLSGCTVPMEAASNKQYQATFLELFDTVTSIVGYADSEESFREKIRPVYDELQVCHQLFDIYNNYEGINNLKTINDQAGQAPVEVDGRIIQLLLDCREYYEVTDGKVNAAMGSVLQLWHEARSAGLEEPENAKLPDDVALKAAGAHMDFDAVVIDETASTVYISDAKLQLDVGAIAKGWATERAAEAAPSGILISVGGNVRVTGPKEGTHSPWVIGLQKPDGEAEEYLHAILVSGGSVVTSGDYQRTYTVDGKKYHHIIDPETLYPSEHWRSVTIVCEDSGVADALSTALFLLTMEEGQALLENYGAMAMWVDADENIYYSAGFEDLIRS